MSKQADGKLKLILIIVAVLVILITGGMFFYQNGIGAVDPDNEKPVTVTIPSGSGGSAIVEILDDAGLIKNKICAKIHIRISSYDALQANTYRFNKSMSFKEIMQAIDGGEFDYVAQTKFILREGETIPQAAASLSEVLPFTKEEIIAKWADRDYLNTLIEKYWFLTDAILAEGIKFPLEGYLYPDTYFIAEEGQSAVDAAQDEKSIEAVTDHMLTMTDKALSERKAAIDQSGMSIHEFLTLASVVESESLFAEDKPKIAGVFINRITDGMPLQSDITVLYALQVKRVKVTNKDTAVESPYNTYKYPGLPIGPVSAVPADTMDAVLHYENNDYLFFFAKEDGTVIYSKTLAEHEKAATENRWY